MPTLVLVGESDHGDFHEIASRLGDALPNARCATIPGAGHLPSLEQPAAVDAVVLPFLMGSQVGVAGKREEPGTKP